MLRSTLLLLVALGGCAFVPEEPVPPAELPVAFAAIAPPEERSAFAVQGGAGEIQVRDRTITGVCHRRERHGAYRRGDTVTFWIAHTGQKGEVCIALGIVAGYRATIGDLPPGEYLLRVEYIGDVNTDSYPRPALEQQVTVR